MAARDVIATCPVCAGELAISRLHCRTCGTTLEGEFGVGRFGKLSREQMALLESFLRSRGNLKEMERALGISYPTVRARVEALVQALGLADGESGPELVDDGGDGAAGAAAEFDAATQRRAILERLAKREIDAAAAAEALRDLEETD
ncbi:MAG TPA: DUF2089 domain-containing protein [Pleomorphomonadaceae bacterium]|nr:DUF2089 domain-containing protein [Pleomorphomonadaceae bacterium]